MGNISTRCSSDLKFGNIFCHFVGMIYIHLIRSLLSELAALGARYFRGVVTI